LLQTSSKQLPVAFTEYGPQPTLRRRANLLINHVESGARPWLQVIKPLDDWKLVNVLQPAADEPIDTSRCDAREGNCEAISAKQIDGRLGSIHPNVTGLIIVCVPKVKLAACRSHDHRRFAMFKQEASEEILVRGVYIENRETVSGPNQDTDRHFGETRIDGRFRTSS